MVQPQPGDVVGGRFRLERMVGMGAFGNVFLATEGSARKVAVKFLDAHWAKDTGIVERFQREGRAALGVSHPGVVEVLDAGATESGLPYLVLEYLEGMALDELLRRAGRLEPAVVSA